MDQFGRKISFTLNGEDTHKTIFGAILTLTIYICCICYFILMIVQPLSASSSSAIEDYANSGDLGLGSVAGNVTINTGDLTFIGTNEVRKTTLYTEREQNQTSLYPQSNGFNVGASFIGNTIDPSTVDIHFYALIKHSTGVIEYEYIESEYCGESHFPAEIEDSIPSLSISFFKCPKSSDIEFVSNRHGNAFKLLTVEAYICNGESYCESLDTISEQFENEYMQLVYVEAYYDQSDVEDPVKYRVNLDHKLAVSVGTFNERNFKIRSDQINYLDSSSEVFYSVRETTDVFQLYLTGFPCAATFELDFEYDVFEQYIYYQPAVSQSRRNLEADNESNIMSPGYMVFYILAQIGGLYTCLNLLFTVFVRNLVMNSYMQACLNQLHKYNKIMKLQSLHQGQIGGVENGLLPNSQSQVKSKFSKRTMPIVSGGQKVEPPQNLKNSRIVNQQVPVHNSKSEKSQTSVICRKKGQSANRLKSMFKQPPPTLQSKSKSQTLKFTSQNIIENRSDMINSGSQDIYFEKKMSQITHNNKYTGSDLLYTLWCFKSKSGNDRTSKASKFDKFVQEKEMFNKDRDLVTIITSINSLKAKINLLEDMMYQNEEAERPETKLGKIPEEVKSSFEDDPIHGQEISPDELKQHAKNINHIVDQNVQLKNGNNDHYLNNHDSQSQSEVDSSDGEQSDQQFEDLSVDYYNKPRPPSKDDSSGEKISNTVLDNLGNELRKYEMKNLKHKQVHQSSDFDLLKNNIDNNCNDSFSHIFKSGG